MTNFSSNDLPFTGNFKGIIDDNTGYTVYQGGQESNSILSDELRKVTIQEPLVMLNRSILVRITLMRHGSPVNVFCTCKQLNTSRAIVMLPCRMNLDPGMGFDSELFLFSDSEPISVHCRVKKISQTKGEDIIRYSLELELENLNGETKREVAAFLRQSRSPEHVRIPA